MQERDAAPARTSSVDLREDDVLRAGQVRQPVDLELVRHQLAVRAAVPAPKQRRYCVDKVKVAPRLKCLFIYFVFFIIVSLFTLKFRKGEEKT